MIINRLIKNTSAAPAPPITIIERSPNHFAITPQSNSLNRFSVQWRAQKRLRQTKASFFLYKMK